ncbi:unnamed protein product [Camellia sinensis]
MREREREREREMGGIGKEALIVCSDKSLGIGITIWDIESGENLLHIPTSASSVLWLLRYTGRAQLLVGSSLFGPSIRPQAPVRSYPMESIEPITCTKDGTYIVGGAPSGNAYVWEISNGRLFRRWHDHYLAYDRVWDLVTGRLLQTRAFPLPITAIVVDPIHKKLFSGSADGTIFLNTLDFGVVEDTSIVLQNEPTLLTGHNGSIIALTFCELGLVSASEDCTACLWDVVNCVVIRRFNHLKVMNHNHKTFNQFRVSVLDKYPKPANSSEGVLTYLPSSSSRDKGHCIASEFRTTDLLKQQILELETGETTATMEMMVETRLESEAWATRMRKHVMEMNKHLQSRLLDMMQCRLLQQPSNVSLTTVKRKRKITNVVEQGKEHHHHPESQDP